MDKLSQYLPQYLLHLTFIFLTAFLTSSLVWAQSYGKGLVLVPESEYRKLPSVPQYRNYLPQAADLSLWFPPVGNQGNQGSCTAWSTTYYMRTYYLLRAGARVGSSAASAMSPSPGCGVTSRITSAAGA